jgi:hypothetical protein
VVRRQRIERPPARQIVAVVALDAVLLDDSPLLLGTVRLLPPIGTAADRGDGTDQRYRDDDLG